MFSSSERDLLWGSAFRHRLEALAIAVRRLYATGGIASRAGTVRGGRVEFLEHRRYSEGDDLRDLDWNVYARTDTPFIKVFGAEREKTVTILLDLSASMTAFPAKDLYARQLAAALLYIALAAGDTVRLLTSGGDHPPLRKGLHFSQDLIAWLARSPSTGPADWHVLLQRYVASRPSPGATILISDFWSEDVVPAIHLLRKMRQDTTLLHILTPEERSPTCRGHLRLVDAESGTEVSYTLTPQALEIYEQTVESHIERLEAGARRHGLRYLLCPTEMPFERLVLLFLRRGGLLR